MTTPETHLALWLIVSIIFFVIGTIAFIVAYFNRGWHRDYIPYHSYIFVISCWTGVISFVIGTALVAGHYLTKIDVVVR